MAQDPQPLPSRRVSSYELLSQMPQNTSLQNKPCRERDLPLRLSQIPWIPSSPTSSSSLSSYFDTILSASPTILSSIGLATGFILMHRVYKNFWRRVPDAAHVPPNWLRKRKIFGRVTSVGDGDNFRLYHTPGGKWTGWGWLPGRSIPTSRSALKDNTIHIRLAGVDAPELPHFGRPGQPFGEEAKQWLTEYIKGQNVRVAIYKTDQYSRIVGTAFVRKGLFRKDIGHEMVKNGFATLYEAATGAEFGGKKEIYQKSVDEAQQRGIGMWVKQSKVKGLLGKSQKVTIETPGQFKQRMKIQGG